MFRHFSAVFLVVAFCVGFVAAFTSPVYAIGRSWPVVAQATPPVDVPGPAPKGKTFADRLRRLAEATGNAMQYLHNDIEKDLLPYFVYVAQALSAVFVIISLLRYLHQHEGADETFVFWFSRVLVCLILIGSGPYLVGWMRGVGISFAFGSTNGDTGTDSYLQRVYLESYRNFDTNYGRFYRNTFLVKVPSLGGSGNLPVPVVPDPDDPGTLYTGILREVERGTDGVELEKRLDLDSMGMNRALNLFWAGRGAFEISEFVSLIIYRLVLLALILFSPFAACAAIDQGGAQRFSINFAWGTAVVTFLFPAVFQMLRIVGYGAANIAFSVGDPEPAAIWNQLQMRPVMESGSFPVLTVIALAGVMTLCGLLQFFSFVLAYKFSTGQVAEAVSSTAQGWISTVTSAGIGYYSATGAAAFQRQAETVQANAQAEAGRVTAAGERHQEIIRAAAGYQSEVARASGAYRGEQARAAGNYQGNLTRNSADAKAEGFRNRAEEQLAPTEVGNKFAHAFPYAWGGVTGPLAEGIEMFDDFTRSKGKPGVVGEAINSQPGYTLYQKALEQAPTLGGMAQPYLEKISQGMENSRQKLGTANPLQSPDANLAAGSKPDSYNGQRTIAQKPAQAPGTGAPPQVGPLNLPPGKVPEYGASQWGNVDSLPVNPTVARTHVGILNSEFLHTQRDQASKREYEGNLEGAKDAFDGQVAAAGITRQGAESAADVRFESANQTIGITQNAAHQAATLHEAAQRMNALGALLSRITDKAGDTRF